MEPAATMPATESSVSRPGALRAPPLGRHHVTRRRVDALLDEALEASLVLVSAPAGAGKSTALSGWLARRDGVGRWYSIEAEDNDPAMFWPSLAEALGLSAASHVTGGREIARAIIAMETVPPGTPTVLVLDDYHAVTNPNIHAGMDQLLVEAPSSLRVVIGTRHDPPLMLARLRAHDALREIRFDDLRFDHGDVAALLNEQMAIGLTRSELTRLTERTEGWAVGVHLVGLSLATMPTVAPSSTSSPATTVTWPTTSETRSWRVFPTGFEDSYSTLRSSTG